MKELVLAYAEYNVWANNRIIESILKLEPGFADREIINSFLSIRATVYHIWSAEYIWLQRLQSVENPVWLAGDFTGSLEAACIEWKKTSDALVGFTGLCDDDALTNGVPYSDRSGKLHSTQASLILHHVFNHSTYHRGQLVTMLRQLGAQGIPGTDFIGFVWKR